MARLVDLPPAAPSTAVTTRLRSSEPSSGLSAKANTSKWCRAPPPPPPRAAEAGAPGVGAAAADEAGDGEGGEEGGSAGSPVVWISKRPRVRKDMTWRRRSAETKPG